MAIESDEIIFVLLSIPFLTIPNIGFPFFFWWLLSPEPMFSFKVHFLVVIVSSEPIILKLI